MLPSVDDLWLSRKQRGTYQLRHHGVEAYDAYQPSAIIVLIIRIRQSAMMCVPVYCQELPSYYSRPSFIYTPLDVQLLTLIHFLVGYLRCCDRDSHACSIAQAGNGILPSAESRQMCHFDTTVSLKISVLASRLARQNYLRLLSS